MHCSFSEPSFRVAHRTVVFLVYSHSTMSAASGAGSGGSLDSCILWTEEQVLRWLGENKWQQYSLQFQDSRIDGDALANLDDAKLQLLGVANSFHRERILRDIRKLQPQAAVPARPATSVAAQAPTPTPAKPPVPAKKPAPDQKKETKPTSILSFLQPIEAGATVPVGNAASSSGRASGSSRPLSGVIDLTCSPEALAMQKRLVEIEGELGTLLDCLSCLTAFNLCSTENQGRFEGHACPALGVRKKSARSDKDSVKTISKGSGPGPRSPRGTRQQP